MSKGVIACIALFCAVQPCAAQRTGVLDPTSEAGPTGELGINSVQPEERVSLAVLLFDPQLERVTRATAWTINIVAAQSEKEAKLQANLCDLGACKGAFTAGATFTAPIDSTTKSAEFADLDGLTGSSRAEGILSYGLTNVGLAPSISLKGVASKPKYTFRESGTLEAAELQRTNWSGTAAIALKGTKWLTQVSFTHERSRKSQKASDICTPSDVGPAGTVVCYTSPIGPPVDAEKNVAAFEMAYVVASVAAVRAKISYDTESEVAGFDVPIYVIPDASGMLSGGVRLGYRTDTDEFTAKLFFALFKL